MNSRTPNTCAGVSPGDGFRPLRIAIIPAAFDPRLSYMENVFAGALHDMGHEVTVFTSFHGVKGDPDEVRALDAAIPFRVVRTNRVLKLVNTLISWDPSIRGEIRKLNPEVAFALAPNHGLGMQWVRHLPDSCRLIAGFSDLPWHRGVFRTWVKRIWARRVIRRACKVVTATRATETLVSEWALPEDRGKIEHIGLPFRAASFSGGAAPPAAAALAKRVKQLIVCVTRVHPSKDLDQLFKSVERYLMAVPDAGFVMAGFDDGAESQRLRALILASPAAGRCEILPLLDAGEIGGLFRIASCSLWSLVSIGIYHALHCGCPVLVRQGQDASHLLAHPAAGAWYPNLNDIDKILPEVLGREPDRAAVATCVDRYDAERMLSRLLLGVAAGAGPG